MSVQKPAVMSIAGLFIIAKTYQQPRYFSLVNGKLCYIQIMNLKRNKLAMQEYTQRKLTCMLRSERSQSERSEYSMISTI